MGSFHASNLPYTESLSLWPYDITIFQEKKGQLLNIHAIIV